MLMINGLSILGSGWLGLPLANHLKETMGDVKLSTRSVTKAQDFKRRGVNPYVIDIESLSNNIQDFLQSETLIINITSKELSAYESLLTEIEKSPIQNVLFISSTSVYSAQQGLCKEGEEIKKESKLRRIEKLFEESTAFNCTIIRFAGLIGPKRHPGRFFATGKSVKDGDAKVNLIHQKDCIKLIRTILERKAWGEIFNGCADNHPTKKTYYTKMAMALGYPEPHCLMVQDSANKVICNKKIKEQLDYEFIYPDVYKIDC